MNGDEIESRPVRIDERLDGDVEDIFVGINGRERISGEGMRRRSADEAIRGVEDLIAASPAEERLGSFAVRRRRGDCCYHIVTVRFVEMRRNGRGEEEKTENSEILDIIGKRLHHSII